VFGYIPQYICILNVRSSSGLSTLSLLVGALSYTSTLASLLALPGSFWAWGCCKDEALAVSCIVWSTLPVMQMMADRMMASGL
jgi:hypothetical protein